MPACLIWKEGGRPSPMHTASCQRRLGKELLPPSPTNLPPISPDLLGKDAPPPDAPSAHHGAPQPTTALISPPRRSSAHHGAPQPTW